MSRQLTLGQISNLGRDELVSLYEHQHRMYNEQIRRAVIQGHRFDVLAEHVLGYQVQPHHRRMLQYQYANLWSLVLVWRGSGKTTICDIAFCVGLVLINPNIRILVASKTAENAKDFLKEIKYHFESNERLREIFGDYVGDKQWDSTAIEVKQRTKPFKEPTINTIGVLGAVASKHYDVIIADDLVDEDNSRTQYQREKMLNWFYKMLLPTLEPPKAGDEFVGRMHILGTRYHYEDLYGHLMEKQPDGTGGELEGEELVVPLERGDGTTEWPEKFPPELVERLKSMGVIRFNTQYNCNCDLMKGRIFQYDDCTVISSADLPDPDGLIKFQGVDLAISEKDDADMFAQVVIGIDRKTRYVYVLDWQEEQLRAPAQTRAIIKMAREWKPVRTGIEANAYQASQIHQVRNDAPELNPIPLYTLKDKTVRAWNLAGKVFENKRIHFLKGQDKLIDHLVLFPDFRYKDLFDALDLAVTAAERRQRKRRKEPGVI